MKKITFVLSTVFVLALTGCADPVNYADYETLAASVNQTSEEVAVAEVPLTRGVVAETTEEPVEETPELVVFVATAEEETTEETPEEVVITTEPTVINELQVTDEQQTAIDKRVLNCLAILYGKTSPKYSLSWLCQYEGIVIFRKSGEKTNHIKCTMDNLQKAANVLGVSADFLINGEN